MMRLPYFQYHAPREVREAVELLAAAAPGDAMLVAGGTDLLPNMKRRQQVPKTLIGLRRIAALRSISNGDGFALGAGVTLTDIVRHPALRRAYTGLWQAAAQVATPHLRNMGTLGGNLCLDTRCNYYDQNYEWRKAIDFCMKKDGETCWVATSSPNCLAVSSTDTAPALIALGASVTLVSAGGDASHPGRGTVPERRYPLPDATADRDPRDRPPAAASTGGAAPTGSCAGAARSTSRCCPSPRR